MKCKQLQTTDNLVAGAMDKLRKFETTASDQSGATRRTATRFNKKVMAEMKTQPKPKSMPFDVKPMAFGAFKTLIQG